MKCKTFGFATAFSFLVFFDLIVCAEELEIAFSYDIPPYVMDNGTKGLEPEIVKEALKYKGHIFTVKQCSYKGLAIAVSQNRFDGAAAVKEIDDGTYYSDNFISFKNYAITKEKAGIILNNISDLKGKNIVTWQNAYRDLGEKFASLFSPNVKASYMEKYHETPVQKEQVRLFWTLEGEVIIIDKSIFIWFTKQLSKTGLVTDKPVYHALFPDKTEFRVNFKSKKIRDDFNEGLKYIRQKGIYQKIFDNHLN